MDNLLNNQKEDKSIGVQRENYALADKAGKPEIPGWPELIQEFTRVGKEMAQLHKAMQVVSECMVFSGREQWITSSEAAAMLGISPRTLATMRKNGRIRVYMLNGKHFYKKQEITSMPGCRRA